MQTFKRRHIAAIALLTSFACIAIATTGDMAQAAEQTPMGMEDVPALSSESLSESSSVEPEELDVAVLA